MISSIYVLCVFSKFQQIQICGCENGGNCTIDGISETSANPLILICNCPEGKIIMILSISMRPCSIIIMILFYKVYDYNSRLSICVCMCLL